MPADLPVIAPVVVLMLATDVSEIDHTPPVVDAVGVMLEPKHIGASPEIVAALGGADTVNAAVAAAMPQLPVTAYEIVVVPALRAVTVPVALTTAIEVSLDDQTPPVTESASTEVPPMHTLVTPVMRPVAGSGATVTKAVAIPVPHPLEIE